MLIEGNHKPRPLYIHHLNNVEPSCENHLVALCMSLSYHGLKYILTGVDGPSQKQQNHEYMLKYDSIRFDLYVYICCLFNVLHTSFSVGHRYPNLNKEDKQYEYITTIYHICLDSKLSLLMRGKCLLISGYLCVIEFL